MLAIDDTDYVETVQRAIMGISPAVTDAAATHGWPAALDAVSTILMSLLIAAVGADEARSACGRMYQDIARLESAWSPAVAQTTAQRAPGHA